MVAVTSWEAPDELKNGVSLLISKLKHVAGRGGGGDERGDRCRFCSFNIQLGLYKGRMRKTSFYP